MSSSRTCTWTEKNQQDLEMLKDMIQEAVRLEPRSLTTKLVAKILCENEDTMIKVSNDQGGLVTLWSTTLTPVEKKYPQEEKELAVLTKYCGTLKDLAQGQAIKVITQSQVHKYLRKGTLESTKATNTRWERWEDMLLDTDFDIGPAQPMVTKPAAPIIKGQDLRLDPLHGWIKEGTQHFGVTS